MFQLHCASQGRLEQVCPTGLYPVTPVKAQREGFMGGYCRKRQVRAGRERSRGWNRGVLRVPRPAEAPPLRRQPGGGEAVS